MELIDSFVLRVDRFLLFVGTFLLFVDMYLQLFVGWLLFVLGNVMQVPISIILSSGPFILEVLGRLL